MIPNWARLAPLSIGSRAFLAIAGCGLLALVPDRAEAQIYRVLHNFGGPGLVSGGEYGMDGANPRSTVAIDVNGNMFGTTTTGGANGQGTVWELGFTGQYKDLHDFGGTINRSDGSTGPDGSTPIGTVIIDASGNLFGTASTGGANSSASHSGGIIWEISATGHYIDLHDFGGTVKAGAGNTVPDGASPYGGVEFDSVGNMYGTTSVGGAIDVVPAGGGIVWKLTPKGVYGILHNFGGKTLNTSGKTGPDGYGPLCSVAIDSSGNLYGTTQLGGPNAATVYDDQQSTAGLIWEITSSGKYEDLHDFGNSTDGTQPMAGVTFDGSGNMFGTAAYGGVSSPPESGVIWEMTSSGTYKVLHDFAGQATYDGSNPMGGVVIDKSGNMFGTTELGGQETAGMLWEITSGGAYKILHAFGYIAWNPDGTQGPDGIAPLCTLATDYYGNVYGTAIGGGSYGSPSGSPYGVVWTWTNSALTFIGASPKVAVGGGGAIEGAFTLAGNPPVGGSLVTLGSSDPDVISVPGSSLVYSDLYVGTFQCYANPVSKTTTVTISATLDGTTRSTDITVVPAVLAQISGAAQVVGGYANYLVIGLNGGASPGGMTISLASSSTDATLPASVHIPYDQDTAFVTVKTHTVTANELITITATSGSVTKKLTFKLLAPQIQDLELVPSQVAGGNTTTGTVTLNGSAPAGGVTVSLSSSSNVAQVPTSVAVPAGKTTATFKVTTSTVKSSTTVTIKAKSGSVTKSATLTVNPT